MDIFIATLLQWGLIGLIVAAFTESFCSPIFPDVVLIPLAIANPENAVYYGLVATLASVGGGFIGYGIGYKIGPVAAKKILPQKYEEKMHGISKRSAAWGIFLAAMAPIPYKFVSITAGALKINLPIFLIASIFGRAKRFLLQGILIYYYGPKAVEIFTQHSNTVLAVSAVLIISVCVGIYVYRRYRRRLAGA